MIGRVLDVRPEARRFVVNGTKRHAIKPVNFMVRPGEDIMLTCRAKKLILGPAVVTKLQGIRIVLLEFRQDDRVFHFRMGVNISGTDLSALQIERLAYNEGFRTGGAPNLVSFVNWLRVYADLDVERPFFGVMVYWDRFQVGKKGR
jgi:hypothetical protein